MRGRPRAVLAAGGTGGHIYAAVGMAGALRGDGWEPVLMCPDEPRTMRFLELEPEAAVFEQRLYPWPGQGFLLPAGLPGAVLRCRRILREIRPRVAVLTGGLASVPVGLACLGLETKVVLFEENAVPGKAARFLAPLAERRLSAMPVKGRKDFHVVGLPLRRRLLGVEPLEKERPGILVFGGSQGARPLDEAVIALYPVIAAHHTKPCVIHVAGPDCIGKASEEFRRHFPEAPSWAGVFPFIRDMERAYAAADVVVCRAGALSVAEVSFLGLPAVLVPYPFAGYHQFHNAGTLRGIRPGTTRLVEQGAGFPERLAEAVTELLDTASGGRPDVSAGEPVGNAGAPFLQALEDLL